MKLYLTGYMASGKSRVGKELAQLSGLSFLDLDARFESRYRLSIFDFFSRYGEPLFREIERGILRETDEMDDVIISTGGGVPCFFSNMAFIKEAGMSVYLRMPVHQLVSRIREARKKRPVLFPVAEEELSDFIARQVAEREVFYQQADHVIDGPVYPLKQILSWMG